MLVFQHLKIRQKLINNCSGPISGVLVTNPHMHVPAMFEADPRNGVQNFPQKLQIVDRRQTTDDRQTDRRTPHHDNSHLVPRTKVAKKVDFYN